MYESIEIFISRLAGIQNGETLRSVSETPKVDGNSGCKAAATNGRPAMCEHHVRVELSICGNFNSFHANKAVQGHFESEKPMIWWHSKKKGFISKNFPSFRKPNFTLHSLDAADPASDSFANAAGAKVAAATLVPSSTLKSLCGLQLVGFSDGAVAEDELLDQQV